MDTFYDFVKNECDNFSLVNITKQLNTRNISSYANTINHNPDKIYIIEKKPSNVRIFRDMNHSDQKYMFMHKDKVFVLHDPDIYKNKDSFFQFLNINQSDICNDKESEC